MWSYARGSVAISTRAPIGHIGVLTQEGCVNQGCRLLTPKGSIGSEFLYFALNVGRDHLAALGQGSTFTELSAGQLASFPIPLPPLREQRAIAEYLDRETAKIDELVAKKERLIELLREKRTALISQAVTKGLDPDSPMKGSGVDWLGEIPAHWDVRRLKYVANILAGQSPPSNLVSDTMDGLPFLQGNAEFGPINPSPRFVCELAPKKCSAGDILLSVRAPVGALNIADRSYGIGRGLCAIRPLPDLVRRFTYFLLLAIRLRLNEMATGSTYDAVTTGDVGNLQTILPPLHEQRAIAEYLDRETAKINELVEKVGRAVELLRELRTALISAAVTGRIDVRAEAA